MTTARFERRERQGGVWEERERHAEGHVREHTRKEPNPSTLEREAARARQVGEQTEAELEVARRPVLSPEREFFVDNLPVRIHFIIVMIRWTGLAPWESEFPFPGRLASTFLGRLEPTARAGGVLGIRF